MSTTKDLIQILQADAKDLTKVALVVGFEQEYKMVWNDSVDSREEPTPLSKSAGYRLV
jgi:hypothetical protein